MHLFFAFLLIFTSCLKCIQCTWCFGSWFCSIFVWLSSPQTLFVIFTTRPS